MMPSVRAAACCIASRVLPRGVAPILRPPLRPNSQITTAAAAVEAAAEVRQMAWRRAPAQTMPRRGGHTGGVNIDGGGVRRLTTEKATVNPLSSPPAKPKRSNLQEALGFLPGLGLSYCVCQAGFVLAGQVSAVTDVPLSGVPVAILLGAAVNNTFAIPACFRPGIKLAGSSVLKLGIVCVGFKLSALEVAAAGAFSVPAVMASVGAG